MTIRYQNTFRDLMGFCFYHYPRSPVVLGVYGVGLGMLSLLAIRALPKDGDTLTDVIAVVIFEVIAFCLVAAVFVLSIILSLVSRKNKTFLTDHTMTLGEESFTEETPYNKTEQKWTIVQKLARTRSYIFIYVAQHMAHVVPRRAFRDEAEWDAFYEYCRRKKTSA